MTQQTLFNKAAAIKARDIALDLVERGASKMWLNAALDAVRRVCLKMAEFTTDDVWVELQSTNTMPTDPFAQLTWIDISHPSEPRAMGAVMRAACQMGLCIRSDRTKNSKKVVCHRRPLRVWITR